MNLERLSITTDDILEAKQQQLQTRQAKTPTAAVIALAEMQRRPFPVLNDVTAGQRVTLIGQVGYSETYDPVGAALRLARAGLDAIAFFTDAQVYDNGLDDLLLVSRGVKRPVIVQDFVLNEYHVTEYRAAGGAALTVYASLLAPALLRRVVSITQRWSMSAVVQVADADQLEMAKTLSPHVLAVGDPHQSDPAHDLRLLTELRPLIPYYTRVMPLHALETLEQFDAALDLRVDAVIVREALTMPTERLAHLLSRAHPVP